MAKYRKKPVEIEAVEWTGDNIDEIDGFSGQKWNVDHPFITIPTPEGNMNARVGDYIIKGVNGEFYPCKPDIFAKTYEPA